jgi:hypothetical protein
MKTLSSLVVIAIVAAPWALCAQGLASVAKKEEERRKAVTSGKVYKNGDLKTDITSSPPPPPAGNASPQAPAATPPAAGAATASASATPGAAQAPAPRAEGVKDEAYWRTRMATARSALERSRIFADALQSRLNALTTDRTNRDDPAQRAQLELEHQRAMAELDRVKKEMAEQTKAIADIEEEARRASVPPGWLR